MQYNFKAFCLATVVVLAIGAVVASEVEAAEFFNSGPSESTSITAANHEGKDKFSAGATLECTTTKLEGTAAESTAASVTLTAKYEGCKFGGVNAEVKMNHCAYVLKAETVATSESVKHGPLSIECAGGSQIEVIAAGFCTIYIGAQSAIKDGLVYTSVTGASGKEELTTHVTAKEVVIDHNNGGPFCFLTTAKGEYTGKWTIKGYEDTGSPQTGTEATTPSAVKEGDQVNVKADDDFDFGPSESTSITAANHEGKDKFSAGATLECTTTKLEGTAAESTAASVTLTAKYEGCKFGGVNAEVKMNHCAYVLKAETVATSESVKHGPLSIECAGGSQIEVIAAGFCTIYIGAQSAIKDGLVYTSVTGASGKEELTTHVTAKEVVIDHNNGGPFCFLTTAKGEYTGKWTIKGYEDTGSPQTGTEATTPSAVKEGDQVNVKADDDFDFGPSESTSITAANHEGKDKFSAGATLECTTTKLEGTAAESTAASVTLTAKYEGCKFGGVNAEVKMNHCAYVLKAETVATSESVKHGPLSIECAGGSQIEVIAAGFCTIYIGAQSAIKDGLVYTSVTGASGKEELTTHVTAKEVVIDHNNGGPFCFLTTAKGEYTGKWTIKGYEDTGSPQTGTEATTPSAVKEGDQVDLSKS